MREVIINGKAKILASKLLYSFDEVDFTKSKCDEILVDNEIPCLNVDNLILANKLDKNIYFGKNLQKLEEYELYNWYYSINFEAEIQKNVFLRFYGVDTAATYFLNGIKIGASENMLVEHEFDISNILKKQNSLVIILESPILYSIRQKTYPGIVSFMHNYSSVLIRQAPHMYGWDIFARAVTCGIWKDISIIYKHCDEVTDCYFETLSADSNSAWVSFFYETSLSIEKFKKAKICISGKCGKSEFSFEEVMYFSCGNVRFMIEKPKLWWTKGYGNPNIYDVTVSIIYDDKILSCVNKKVGIRKINLLRDDIIKENSEFCFELNGNKIMVRGTNHVPMDCFHTNDLKKTVEVIDLIDKCNCNMIRCWGGNVYESDLFFDECDRRGIMVWQDFALACNLYPQDDKFCSIIQDEVTKVVKRLRNHPCLALYCGDNECDYGYNQFGIDPNKNKLTRKIIPDVITQQDPLKHYLPSSPFYSKQLFESKNLNLLPEEHLWGPRDYFKSKYYQESKCHFVSEIGYHGCPKVASIKKFIPAESLWDYKNTMWTYHCTSPSGDNGPFTYRNQLMANQIKVMFGVDADNLDDFSLMSQISQAEADKFFVESTRLKKWNKTGLIWWNMIDGCPQFSDSVVDYYGQKKLAYYYLQKAQEPVQIFANEPENWQQSFVIANDTPQDISGECYVYDENHKPIFCKKFEVSKTENKTVGAVENNPSEKSLLLLEIKLNSGKTVKNHYLRGFVSFDYNKYQKYLTILSEWYGSFSFINKEINDYDK